jgi:hypothetical protein
MSKICLHPATLKMEDYQAAQHGRWDKRRGEYAKLVANIMLSPLFAASIY